MTDELIPWRVEIPGEEHEQGQLRVKLLVLLHLSRTRLHAAARLGSGLGSRAEQPWLRRCFSVGPVGCYLTRLWKAHAETKR